MSDLLDAMEQRAHEHLLLNWRDTLADDVLALVGRVREMDATMAGLRARCVRDEARVAVLREALDDANKTCNFQSVGWGRELGARLNLVLATLDPAATALTERLKAWESAPFFRSDGGREAHHCLSHAAWRKVKGETP